MIYLNREARSALRAGTAVSAHLAFMHGVSQSLMYCQNPAILNSPTPNLPNIASNFSFFSTDTKLNLKHPLSP